jgi:hypothetical protein
LSRAGVDRFLDSLTADLVRFNSAQATAALSSAPLLNPFDFLAPNEVRFSRILAMLFDPRGVHGQGPIFLRRLLSSLGLQIANLDRATVYTEWWDKASDLRRRIDVVIETEEWTIGIENKVWGAPDQVDQVVDYLSALARHRSDKYLLLYLTPHGSMPSEESIPKAKCDQYLDQGKLRVVSCEQLALLIDTCIVECHAQRAIWFAQSLRDYIRYRVVGKPHALESNMIVTSLLEPGNDARLETALELLRYREEIRQRLTDKMLASVVQKLPPGWALYRDKEQGAPLLGLKAGPSLPWFFTVEFEDGRYWYGIRHTSDSTPTQREEVLRGCENLSRVIRSEPVVPDYTPFWREFDGQYSFAPAEYSNWEASVRPWLDMANGTMADRLVEAAERLDLRKLR